MNIKIDHVTDNGISFKRMLRERTPRDFSGPFVGWRTEEQITKPPEIEKDEFHMIPKENSQTLHSLPDQADDLDLPDQADDHANKLGNENWDSIFSDTTSSSEHLLESSERNKKPQIDLANYFAGINRKMQQKSAGNCFVLKGFTTWSH